MLNSLGAGGDGCGTLEHEHEDTAVAEDTAAAEVPGGGDSTLVHEEEGGATAGPGQADGGDGARQESTAVPSAPHGDGAPTPAQPHAATSDKERGDGYSTLGREGACADTGQGDSYSTLEHEHEHMNTVGAGEGECEVGPDAHLAAMQGAAEPDSAEPEYDAPHLTYPPTHHWQSVLCARNLRARTCPAQGSFYFFCPAAQPPCA